MKYSAAQTKFEWTIAKQSIIFFSRVFTCVEVSSDKVDEGTVRAIEFTFNC